MCYISKYIFSSSFVIDRFEINLQRHNGINYATDDELNEWIWESQKKNLVEIYNEKNNKSENLNINNYENKISLTWWWFDWWNKREEKEEDDKEKNSSVKKFKIKKKVLFIAIIGMLQQFFVSFLCISPSLSHTAVGKTSFCSFLIQAD